MIMRKFRVYAQQTGLIPALGLSFFKSPIILLLDIFVITICIYYVVRLFTFFLGVNGKYAAMTIIIFAILSGAPNQFGPTLYSIYRPYGSSFTPSDYSHIG